MTLPHPLLRPCPTNHRNIDEDGCRVERDGAKRWAFILATCRDCGARLEQRWELSRRERFGWLPVDQRWHRT